MVDNLNPTSQFHPYQPVTDTPVSERPNSILGDMLSKVGINPNNLGAIGSKLKNVNVNDVVGKVRGYARSNPGIVLGGLAALVIGAGLMRKRTM